MDHWHIRVDSTMHFFQVKFAKKKKKIALTRMFKQNKFRNRDLNKVRNILELLNCLWYFTGVLLQISFPLRGEKRREYTKIDLEGVFDATRFCGVPSVTFQWVLRGTVENFQHFNFPDINYISLNRASRYTVTEKNLSA